MSHDFVISVDVGGTKIAYALVDSSGNIHDYGTVKTEKAGGKRVIDQLREIVRFHYDRTVLGVGLSVPGIVRGGLVVWAPNIRGWREIPLAKLMSEEVPKGVPVEVIDDRAACALGELWQGAARNLTNFVVLIVGTGVGAGIVIDGKPVRGSTGVAGSIGWWLLSNKVPFRASRRGYLEDATGGKALCRVAKRYSLARTQAGVTLRELCEYIDFACLLRAYDLGCEIAGNALERRAVLLGVVVANLLSLLNPEAVILSGSIGVELGKRFMPVIRRTVEAVAQPYAAASCRIEVSNLGHLSCVYGSAYSVLTKLQKVDK